MWNRKRSDFGFAKVKGPGYDMGFGFKIAGEGIERLEGELKSAQIIEAHDVVRMRMSKDDRVDFANVRPKGLRPEIGASIDDERALGSLDIDR